MYALFIVMSKFIIYSLYINCNESMNKLFLLSTCHGIAFLDSSKFISNGKRLVCEDQY